MSFKKMLAEIQRMIDASPYTRAEIALFWQAEDEKEWEPETIMALAVAYEYLNRTGKPEVNTLREKYTRLLGQLRDRYSRE